MVSRKKIYVPQTLRSGRKHLFKLIEKSHTVPKKPSFPQPLRKQDQKVIKKVTLKTPKKVILY